MNPLIVIMSVFLGFLLGVGKDFWNNRKKQKINYKAILSEATFCSYLAQVYIESGIKAPLYRLPTKAYECSLPQLLSSSAIADPELRAIQQFYMEVESLNRGLDLADLSRDNQTKLRQEHDRNIGKAQRLLSSGESRENYYRELNRLLSKYA